MRIKLILVLLLLTSALKAETLDFVISIGHPPLSSEVEGEPTGMFPELIKLVFSYTPEYEIDIKPFPWKRAQLLVESGKAQGFMTYPSSKRKNYAVFSADPFFVQDFGYLIYHKKNVNRFLMEGAKSFQDIANLTAIVERGSEWVRDNIPAYINRLPADSHDIMLNLLFYRKDGDFIVMAPEMAIHAATKLGYQNDLAYQPVKFINDSLIPFHIGISKKHSKSKEIITVVNSIVESSEFLLERQKLFDKYR